MLVNFVIAVIAILAIWFSRVRTYWGATGLSLLVWFLAMIFVVAWALFQIWTKASLDGTGDPRLAAGELSLVIMRQSIFLIPLLLFASVAWLAKRHFKKTESNRDK